ncbi:MAG TPA: aquaporin [Nitrososphaerales archaeon]|nr:aquaporin [Nitrososphaerales archaeon]
MQVPCYGCKKECLSELLGTYVLVVLGPASVVVFSSIPSLLGLESPALIALTFGGTVALLILALGKHSGAAINPAVTVAVASARLLKKGFFLPYVVFQMAGGVLAGLTLRALFLSFNSGSSLGATKLASGISPFLGITVEAVGTFVLASSALIASTRIKNVRNQGLFVGTTLFILIMFIGPLTGAGFNPARSLGPSLVSGYFTNLYVYLIGPIAGALVAGLLFRVMTERGRNSRNLVCLC